MEMKYLAIEIRKFHEISATIGAIFMCFNWLLKDKERRNQKLISLTDKLSINCALNFIGKQK